VTAGAALFAAACVFAVVYGANAGSALLSMGLVTSTVPPWASVILVAAAVAGAPLLLGTAVAGTVSRELVTLDGDPGRWLLLAAVVCTIAVVTVLSWLGLPTSMTLALLSGLAGVGIGSGTQVAWGRFGEVFAGLALAPVLGAVTTALMLAMMRPWSSRGSMQMLAGRVHVFAFLGLVIAFGANDGQKILAVMVVAAGPATGPVALSWLHLIAAGVLFALGAALGLKRMAGSVNRGVLSVRPDSAATTELATAAVMIGGSTVGAPVGMSQVLTGALVGIGMSSGRRRIRWEFVARLVMAWVVTVPTTLLTGMAAGLVVGALAA